MTAAPWFRLAAATVLAVAVTAGGVPAVAGEARLGPLINLRTGYFPFHPPQTVKQWQQRSAKVRRQVLVATGQWPPPARPDIQAVVHGRVEREDYTVDKVYFESAPGHFVTGSLYRPKGTSGPHPAVLTPYGHWQGGRYQDLGSEQVSKEIARGGERYEAGGLHPLQARCVQLARMGCIVFMYDLLGYADSQQLSENTIHRTSAETVFAGSEGWSFYSTPAELRLQSPLGLQTYNSLCALDWIVGLPGVDDKRIGIVGGSGGATQVLLLGAIDERPAAMFAAVMVSTAMQGGCPCENACNLRIDSGNVELAGLFAPRPQGMSCADDWTRETLTKGFPELQQLYRVLGAPHAVSIASLTQFPHNFNYPSRLAMYDCFNDALKLGFAEPIEVRDYVPLTPQELRVWTDDHPAPPGGREHEIALLKSMAEASDEQMEQLQPRDSKTLEQFREVVGGAFEVLVACDPVEPGDVVIDAIEAGDTLGLRSENWLVRRESTGAELPVRCLLPAGEIKRVVLWVTKSGKQGIVDSNGELLGQVRELVEANCAVMAADLLYQGDLLPSGEPISETRVSGDKPAAGLTFGYNRTVVAHRAADILTLLAVAHKKWPQVSRLLVAERGSAPYAAAAVAIAGDRLDGAAIDTGGFRFTQLESWRDPNFLPGAVKYGDLPAMLALSAPRPLLIAGEPSSELELVAQAYRSASSGANLKFAAAEDFRTRAAQFVLNRP